VFCAVPATTCALPATTCAHQLAIERVGEGDGKAVDGTGGWCEALDGTGGWCEGTWSPQDIDR